MRWGNPYVRECFRLISPDAMTHKMTQHALISRSAALGTVVD